MYISAAARLSNVITLLLLSFAGSWLFKKIRCPAPQILGAMCMVIAAKLLGLDAVIPKWADALLAAGAGILVGTQFEVVLSRKLAGMLAFACTWLISTGLLIGGVLTLLGMEADTALFAALPGGIVELSFVSAGFSADTFQVTVLHASRMVTMIVVMPLLIRRLPRAGRQTDWSGPPAEPGAPAGAVDWAVMLLLGILLGTLLERLRVPVGAFVGALAASAVYCKIRNIRPVMARQVRSVLEAGIGAGIGTRVGMESVLAIPHLLLPLIVLNALMTASSLLLGRALSRMFGLDRVTAQLAAVPGGSSPFIMLAGELDADISLVTVFHLCRYLSMVIFSVILGIIITVL